MRGCKVMKLENYLRLIGNEIEAIKQWAQDEHKEEELLSLIPILAKNQLQRVERERDYMKIWASNTVDMYQVDGVTEEEAHYYNRLFQCVIAGKDVTEGMLSWLEEHVPQREIPSMFFRPALVYLSDRGIRFKNDNEEYGKTCSVRRPKF